MTADTQIPEDIMQTASELARHTGWYQRHDALNMAKAILAERERCAKIAEAQATDIYRTDDVGIDAYTIGQIIAAAIRKGA